MPKFGEVSWKLEATLPRGKRKATFKFDLPMILDFFELKDQENKILNHAEKFANESKSLAEAISASEAIFETIHLLSSFVAWSKDLNEPELNDAKLLLDNGFIGLKDAEGDIWTLKHASLQDPNRIFDAIRCKRNWSLLQRERLVSAYKSFIFYLSTSTNNYISTRADQDLEHIRLREIKHREFITFADYLNENCQLVAKLLYFGWGNTLEEILNLEISDVEFDEESISFGNMSVPYPLHVFADIKAIIGKRSKGLVFLGRQNAPLNPATIFRNFKEAATKTGMPFGISWFTLDIDPYEHL